MWVTYFFRNKIQIHSVSFLRWLFASSYITSSVVCHKLSVSLCVRMCVNLCRNFLWIFPKSLGSGSFRFYLTTIPTWNVALKLKSELTNTIVKIKRGLRGEMNKFILMESLRWVIMVFEWKRAWKMAYRLMDVCAKWENWSGLSAVDHNAYRFIELFVIRRWHKPKENKRKIEKKQYFIFVELRVFYHSHCLHRVITSCVNIDINFNTFIFLTL